jgi:NhaP-type Na+/H+ or K+/H+ antiporter
MNEDVVDFIHGCLIGLLVGFVLGIFLTKTLGLL